MKLEICQKSAREAFVETIRNEAQSLCLAITFPCLSRSTMMNDHLNPLGKFNLGTLRNGWCNQGRSHQTRHEGDCEVVGKGVEDLRKSIDAK